MTGVTRAEITELTLRERSRRRPLTEDEKSVLEEVVAEQLQPRLDRAGARRPRRYLGAATLWSGRR